ncbi:MAG: hypothetical protein Athens071416_54 [Parcubacteria group bacterium Athens0714_16]|nr:MAG: hypothetical protein Athens071416_54 [Parcubacteria group bacterium Athens0714_16]
MKKSIFLTHFLLLTIFISSNIFSQKQILNGKEHNILFSKDLFSVSSAGFLVADFKKIKNDSASIQFNELRVLVGLKYNFLELKTDVSLKKSEDKMEILSQDFVNQIYIQTSFAVELPVSIKIGRFKTAAALSVPYEYETYTAKGLGVGEPFFGLYAGGVQIELQAQKNVKFIFDVTNLAYPIGQKPFYGEGKNTNLQTSGLLIVNIINYDLTIESSFEYSNERLRWGAGFDLYNSKSGPFFFNGDVFFEEALFSYRMATGLKFNNFDWHVQAENGLESSTGKRSFITTGVSFNFNVGDLVNNKLIIDYQTPLGEEKKDWAVFGSLRLTFN